MSSTQPVLKDEPFAGPAWNASVTILALEKLQAGEELNEDERQAVARTAEFVRSLVRTPCEDDLSMEAGRNRKFWRQNTLHPKVVVRALDLQLEALREHLESGSRKEVVPLIPQIQVEVLNTLEVINYCRRD